MHKISSRQVFAFACMLSCFLFPGFGDTLLLQTGKNSSIIASILGTILGLIPILIIIAISKQTTTKNIFELNKERFKFFGFILNFLLIIGVIYIMIVGTWSIINFTVSQFLTRTSYYLVLFVMNALVAYAILKKTEVIGRTAIVLLISFIMITVFSWIFLIPLVDTTNLYPIMDVSKTSFLKTILMHPTFCALPLISLLFIKRNEVVDKENINIKIILGYIFGAILSTGFLFLIISVFGSEMSALFTYPEYTLFKKINVLDFIQRIENIIASIIFIASFIAFCVMNSFLKEYVKTTFKIKKETVLNIVITILIFAIPFVSVYGFQNYLIISLYEKYPLIASFIFIVLVINYVLLLITKKKETKKVQ